MSFEHTAYTDTFGEPPAGGRPNVRVSMPGARRSETLAVHPNDWTPGVHGKNPWTAVAADATLIRHGWTRTAGTWTAPGSTRPYAPVEPRSEAACALAADPDLAQLGQTLDAVPRRIAIGITAAAVWIIGLVLTAAALLSGRDALTAWLVVFGIVFLAAAVVALIPPPHGRPAAVLAFAIGLPMLTAALVLAATAPDPPPLTADDALCQAYADVIDEADDDSDRDLLGIYGGVLGAEDAESYARGAARDAGCPAT